MVATSLIKTKAEQQELLKQLFPADARGIHQLTYGLSASDFNNGNLASGLATPPTVIAASTEEQRFIQFVFSELAKVIKLRATQVNSLTSPMQIVSVQTVRDDQGDPNTTGITYSAFSFEVSPSGQRKVIPARSGITIEAELNDDQGLSPSEKRTTVHEIGHGLGLEHPGGNPNDPDYTDRDTIMSYRVGGNEPATWFSDSDLGALQEIWGAADDASSGGGSNNGRGNGGGNGQAERTRIDAVTGLSISGFESGLDQLELNAGLPGLRNLSLRRVGAGRKSLKKAQLSSAPLLYQPSSGDLFLNANGATKGLGEGGLLAKLGPGTGLVQADLVLG